MWVEPDCNMPAGESLARQLLYGQRWFQRRFGAYHTVCWAPDCFGFTPPAAAPAIHPGVRRSSRRVVVVGDGPLHPRPVLAKGARAGAAVLAHMSTTPTSGTTAALAPLGARDVARRTGSRRRGSGGQPRWSVGDGDGAGGGPTEEMAQRARDWTASGAAGAAASAASTSSSSVPRRPSRSARCPLVGQLYLESSRDAHDPGPDEAAAPPGGARPGRRRGAERVAVARRRRARPRRSSRCGACCCATSPPTRSRPARASARSTRRPSASWATSLRPAPAPDRGVAGRAGRAAGRRRRTPATVALVANPGLSARRPLPRRAAGAAAGRPGGRARQHVHGPLRRPWPASSRSPRRAGRGGRPGLRRGRVSRCAACGSSWPPTGRSSSRATTSGGARGAGRPHRQRALGDAYKPRATATWTSRRPRRGRRGAAAGGRRSASWSPGPHRAALRVERRFRDSRVVQNVRLSGGIRARRAGRRGCDRHDRRWLAQGALPARRPLPRATFETAFGVVERRRTATPHGTRRASRSPATGSPTCRKPAYGVACSTTAATAITRSTTSCG